MATESSLTTGSNTDLEGMRDIQATIHFPECKDFAKNLRAIFDDSFDRDPLCDCTVLVTGFPPESFIRDDDDVDVEDEELLIPRRSRVIYFEESQTLVVTMAGGPHEVSGMHFEQEFCQKLGNMGCLDEITSYGSKTVRLGNVEKERPADIVRTAGSNTELEGLSDIQATIHFPECKGFAKKLRAIFDNTYDSDPLRDCTVLVTGFPPESFIRDDDDVDVEDEELIPRQSRVTYLEESQILVVTMPGGPHEVTSGLFGQELTIKLGNMGCLDEIIPHESEKVSLGSVQKEADKSWGPEDSRHITCVLETAVSESRRALHSDVTAWLESPKSHVAQVITIKLSRTRAEIHFCLWKRDQAQKASVDHELLVILEDGRPIAQGTQKTLTISFEELFERRPRAGTKECDIVLSERELGGIARKVWKEMGFQV